MARSKNARSKSGACPSLCTTTTAKGELAIRLRTKNSMATYDVFTDVMEHAEKFSHVTTPEGAFAFNQMFEEPVSRVFSSSLPPIFTRNNASLVRLDAQSIFR